jgi:hypothetical protein
MKYGIGTARAGAISTLLQRPVGGSGVENAALPVPDLAKIPTLSFLTVRVLQWGLMQALAFMVCWHCFLLACIH